MKTDRTVDESREGFGKLSAPFGEMSIENVSNKLEEDVLPPNLCSRFSVLSPTTVTKCHDQRYRGE
jgi:hypothetical protein